MRKIKKTENNKLFSDDILSDSSLRIISGMIPILFIFNLWYKPIWVSSVISRKIIGTAGYILRASFKTISRYLSLFKSSMVNERFNKPIIMINYQLSFIESIKSQKRENKPSSSFNSFCIFFCTLGFRAIQ